MQPDDRTRLLHLREAAEKCLRFTDGKDRDDLDHDELLRLALTKLIEIVGETAKYVSAEFKDAHPAVPWQAAGRMRDRLIHPYFDIDLDILWQTVTDDLPRLLAAVPDRNSDQGSDSPPS